jgi:adenosylcobinamide-phosphate synthase
VNTADAMWGYRNAKYEKWGKIAARMDDVLNWIPARLTGLWLLWFPNSRPPNTGGSIQQLRTESRKTPSPNSGWSMAAFAIRLGVHLGKPGVYVLNPQGADVDAELTIAGIRWITRSGWVLALIMALLGALRFEFRGWLYG